MLGLRSDPSPGFLSDASCACVEETASGPHDLADRLGIGVSLTCAVHCAATGALSLAPSLVGTSGEALEAIEMPLLALALVIGLYSLVPAYRSEHGRPQPLGLFLGGLGVLFVSRLVDGNAEIATTVLGVGLVAVAHFLNLRFCARSHDHASASSRARSHLHTCTLAPLDARS